MSFHPIIQSPLQLMRSAKALVIAAATFAFCTSQLLAQQQEAQISTKFTTLSLGNTISNLQYDSGSNTRSPLIPNGSRSPEYQYSGPATLVFYIPEKGPEGETIKKPVASVNLAGFTNKEPLLVFINSNSAPGQYVIFPIDDSASGFTGNSWRVFNFTPANLALKVGSTAPRTISPGTLQTFAFSSQTQTTQPIQIAVADEDGWQIASRSIWSHEPGMRSLIFLFPSTNGRSVRVQRFDQFINAPQ